MYTNLSESRSITIYIDEKKNIVVLPVSKEYVGKEDFGADEEGYRYIPSKEFFELKTPYSLDDVANIIEKGIEAYLKYEPYTDKKSFEEVYYGIKGFKNATKGKRCLDLGWNDNSGKSVSLLMPMKTGKCYIGIVSYELPDNADWMDFAKVVIKCIDVDVTELDAFKTYRRRLNI